MKKLIALTLSLIILVSLIPATFAGAGPGFQIEKYTLRVGESTLLDYCPESGNVTSMQWISSNPSVGTIDKNGKFTALNAGTTEITVKYTKVYPTEPEWGVIAGEDKTTLTVVGEALRPKLAGKIAVYVGETAKWTANKWVWWTSGNPGVATIDQQGNIKTYKAGKTHITATAADGSKMTVTFFVYNRAY